MSIFGVKKFARFFCSGALQAPDYFRATVIDRRYSYAAFFV